MGNKVSSSVLNRIRQNAADAAADKKVSSFGSPIRSQPMQFTTSNVHVEDDFDDEEYTVKERMMDALVHGAKTAAVDEIGNTLLTIAKVLFGDSYPALAQTEDGQSVLKGITAGALMFGAIQAPGVIPAADGVVAACELQLEASSRDFLQPKLALVQPLLKQLADASGVTGS